MYTMKVSRNRSGLYQGSSQERGSDKHFRYSAALLRVILHALLCFAAIVVGFRLSGEARLVIISLKPSHGTFLSNSITRFHRARHFGVLSGDPFVEDDRRDLTPTSQSGSPPLGGIKSSRVHVGRHEILVRSWPHPDPVQTRAAHKLIERVQEEQQRAHGLQERKQLIVVTPTYIRALQAVYLSSLIHTLRIVPDPLIWIVVEAGGISNETAELLSQSQLSHHHLTVQEPMPADSRQRKQLKTRLRIEGLRFIRNQRLDGIVIFLDDSSTCSLELFDVTQNIDWLGSFSVGLLLPSRVPVSLEEGAELSLDASDVSKEGKFELEFDRSGATEELNILMNYERSSAVKEDSVSRFMIPLMGPVCNSQGHVVGWYVPFEEEQVRNLSKHSDWEGFALNSRMLWEDASKPSWIKSWDELLKENHSLPESPLLFLKNNSYIEPLGDCGRNVLMWWMQVEAVEGCKFPSRWTIDPPLEVVVPSRKTPWPPMSSVEIYTLGSRSPPPPHVQIPTETIIQHAKSRRKSAKSRKGKHRFRHKTGDETKSNAELAA